MYKSKLDISAGAIFLFSALYFFGGAKALSVVAICAAVHELGHFAAIKLLGGRVIALRFEASGLCMSYAGLDSTVKEAVFLLMGPLFGFAFAYIASCLGNRFYSEYLFSAAGVSFIFSAYNILPALPLDGGRVLFCLIPNRSAAEKTLDICGMAVGISLIGTGLYFLGTEKGAAFLISGVFVLISQTGIVKNYGML